MKVYSHFIYCDTSLYLLIDNISEYQRLYHKDSTRYSLDFAKYEYLYKLVEFLYRHIPDIKLIQCECEGVPNVDGMVLIDFNFDSYLVAKLFVDKGIEAKIFYYLHKANYSKLFQDVNLANHGLTSKDGISDNQKIPFPLVHGEVMMKYSQVLNLQIGDMVILDSSLAPNSCKVVLGNLELMFEIKENQLILS